MKSEEIDLLNGQLDEALAEEPVAGEFELASLAGLLARLDPDNPRLRLVDGRLSDIVLRQIIKAAETGREMVEAIEEDDDPALSWNALCAMDEACAAAAFVARPALAEEEARQAARWVRAFPEPFQAHADAAARVLLERPPLEGDPAVELWTEVEWSRVPRTETEGLSPGILALVRPVRVPLPELRAAAASENLMPLWQELARGQGYTLALSEDNQRERVLLVDGALPEEVQAVHGDEPVAPRRFLDALAWAARPGRWSFTIRGRTFRFEVE